MKAKLAAIFAVITWFALITQYILMVENRSTSMLETTVRFFSFFTILTNALVAIYFTCLALPENNRPKVIAADGTLTAVTVYITMVGSVYQILLRHIWEPHGMQLVVDELLHSIVPVLVVIFWYLYESKARIEYSQMLKWGIYPLAYLFYILIRGHFSGFYPYHFIDVTKLGLEKTLITSVILLLIFFAVSSTFIFAGRLLYRNETQI
ncbi:MAG: Pr6Pr family membrane protein [Chryseolinea sp.]